MTNDEKAAQWDPEMLALLADVKASIDTYLHRRKRKGKISSPSRVRIQDELSALGETEPLTSASPHTLPGDDKLSKLKEPAA